MAKGDEATARNEASYQKNRFESQINPVIGTAGNMYQQSALQGKSDYNDLMNRYRNFAVTGGYSPEDISAMRARAISPVQGQISQVENEINRQRALQGGYSPNATAALAKMGRTSGQAVSDAATNVDAYIAQLLQQGKLAGSSGASSLYGTSPGMANMFGNQVLNAINQSAGFGNEQFNNYYKLASLPTGWDRMISGLGAIGNMASGVGGASNG